MTKAKNALRASASAGDVLQSPAGRQRALAPCGRTPWRDIVPLGHLGAASTAPTNGRGKSMSSLRDIWDRLESEHVAAGHAGHWGDCEEWSCVQAEERASSEFNTAQEERVGTWGCPQCGESVLLSHQRCTNCGCPQ